jgi:hypothetical protein
MDDLINSTSTTAEQKFMLMMFERLEKLEDKVASLTVENQNLKDKLKCYDIPDLPVDIYISKQLVTSPVFTIYCKITLDHVKYLELSMRMLKQYYSEYVFLPHFFSNIRSPYKDFKVPKDIHRNAVDLHCLLTSNKPQTVQQHVYNIHQKLKSGLLDYCINSRCYPAIAACSVLYMGNYYFCREFSYHQRYVVTNRALCLNKTYAMIAKESERIFGELMDVGIDYRHRDNDHAIMTVVNLLRKEWNQKEIIIDRIVDSDDESDREYDSDDIDIEYDDDDDYDDGNVWEDY